MNATAPLPIPRKAVILLSGGLDSTLAARIVRDQGIELHAIHFTSPFCTCSHRGPGNGKGCRSAAQEVAAGMGIPIHTVSKGEEYLEIVKHPRHGRGSAMNPCIDCRIFTLRKAKAFMEEIGASFLVTGEVVGQRPMSQRDDALRGIEKHSGCAGIVLRPLSALHLPPPPPGGKLLTIDTLSNEVSCLTVVRDRSCSACGEHPRITEPLSPAEYDPELSCIV